MCFGLKSSPRLKYELSKVNYSPTPWGLVSHRSTCKSPHMPHVSPDNKNTHVLWCLLSVLNGKLTNYDVTKSSSDNFPKFPRTVPFVRPRKRAIFNVEYIGDVVMKSCKTLDYDYFDYNLLFRVKIKPGPISLHLTFK